MSIRIHPSPLRGNVDVIGSKSLSHRYMIAAALAHGKSVLSHRMHSEDLDATCSILTALGAQIEGDDVVGPIHFHAQTRLNAKASGSTLRFLIPLLLLSNQVVVIEGEDRLPFRSLEAYQTVCKTKGLHFKPLASNQWLPLELKGPLQPGVFELDGSVSSQFVSGLMFALPLLDRDSHILMSSPLTSKPYVSMTIHVLKDFGIKIEETDQGYFIPGQQTYLPLQTVIESDYSHSVFFLAAGALSGPIRLGHFQPSSVQGDEVVKTLFENMEAQIEHVGSHIHVRRSTLKPFNADFEDCLDLVPMMALLAATIDGRSTLSGLSRLKYKESDRLSAIKTLLKLLHVTFEVREDVLIIQGQNSLHAQSPLPTFNDHRFVMALAMLAPFMANDYIIEDIESVRKSYPEFFDVYQQLGGRIEVIEGGIS